MLLLRNAVIASERKDMVRAHKNMPRKRKSPPQERDDGAWRKYALLAALIAALWAHAVGASPAARAAIGKGPRTLRGGTLEGRSGGARPADARGCSKNGR